MLREIEQSSIQEYLWHNSRVTTAVFCTYSALESKSGEVDDHPQLSYEGYLRFLEGIFPSRTAITTQTTAGLAAAASTKPPLARERSLSSSSERQTEADRELSLIHI